MSASLKLHCTVLRCVRQANPTEDHRCQRTFAWAVVAVILTGSASLGEWIGAVVSQAQSASTWRRLWRLMNNSHVDVASYYVSTVAPKFHSERRPKFYRAWG